MSKQINKNIKAAVEKDLGKRKILKLNIGGEEYTVKIKCALGVNDKVEILNRMAEYTQSEKLAHALTAFTLALYEVVTDIDFGETTEEKVELLTLLGSGDYLEKIQNAIPEKLIVDLTEHINRTADILEQDNK